MKKETIIKRINQLKQIFEEEYRWQLMSWLNSDEPYNRQIDLIAEDADYIAWKIGYYENILRGL